MTTTEYRVLFPFCGLGAGARGFLDARATLFGKTARFVSVGGIDIDDAACQDFVYLTKSPALTADVAALTPEQLRDFAGKDAPDVVFLSAPCVGSSKLISDAKAAEPRYQALNKLAEVWIRLMLDAWGTAPPKLVLFENVPNIVAASRAKAMVGRVKKMLRAAGYVMHDGFHECGELGGLAQKRRRWLMVARHAPSVAPLLYQPSKKRVRGCGEVIGPLPMPGDPAGGAMHTLPKISWLNWVRLALIPAGGDWRDLPGVVPEGTDRRDVFKRHEVCAWDKPCGTVGGPGSNGVENIADARGVAVTARFSNIDRVTPWTEPTPTVCGRLEPASGGPAIADPRAFKGGYGVQIWGEPANTVISEASVSNGGSIADPRVPLGTGGVRPLPFALTPSANRHDAKYAVGDWAKPAKTVTGATRPGSGSLAVADPRTHCLPFGNVDRVTAWDEPVGTITRSPAPSSGGGAIADRRAPAWFRGVLGVIPWKDPAGVVTASSAVSRGAFAVGDPRRDLKRAFDNVLRVVPWDKAAGTVTGAGSPSNGAACVADPRTGLVPVVPPFDKAYGVLDWQDPARTVAGGSDVGQGAYAIADVREVQLGCEPRRGAYGVLSWEEAAKTITAAACHDNGPFAIADMRIPDAVPLCVVKDVRKAPVGGVPVIIAADGTWHRPLTTLELAVLQGIPHVIDGKPLCLAGTNATEWRRRIGNAVPPPAARAIAERMLVNLLGAAAGAFSLSGDGSVWVAPKKTRGRLSKRARVLIAAREVAKMERTALLGTQV